MDPLTDLSPADAPSHRLEASLYRHQPSNQDSVERARQQLVSISDVKAEVDLPAISAVKHTEHKGPAKESSPDTLDVFRRDLIALSYAENDSQLLPRVNGTPGPNSKPAA